MKRHQLLFLLPLLAACRERDQAAPIVATAALGTPDSLVLRAPGGAEVWMTRGRTAATSSGQSCEERTIEIRHDSARVRVPLLYTGDLPTLVNDSTLEARLWLHCVPGDRYRVSLRTGQPVKVP